jgi:S1-C subfamily serine protease
MNRRYIASLAVGAVVTLAAGLFVRHKLDSTAAPPAAAVPPTETAALQELSQESQARRMSALFRDRAADVAPLVEYISASQASGLRWGGGDTMVTTLPSSPVVALRAIRADTSRAPVVATTDSVRGEWTLIVARRPDGGIVSTVGVIGGRLPSKCGDQTVSEYVVGVPSHDGFAGAAMFDLAGRVVGLIARCGTRLAALPATEVSRLLAGARSLGSELERRFGFSARPLDDAARRYFRTDSGLLVVAVADDTPAARAGWEPGDVIVDVDGAPLGNAAIFDTLAPDTSHAVTIRRNGTSRSTRLSPGAIGPSDHGVLGISLANPRTLPGVVIGEVQRGSIADSAGLESGDRLVRVGSVAVSSPAVARRLLGRIAASDSTTFLVFRRDSVTRGILLPR